MVAGHLQEKKGLFYIVLNYKDEEGKRKSKWLATGLPVKGNKKKAESLLMDARRNFEWKVSTNTVSLSCQYPFSASEVNLLLEIVKGTKIELAVIVGAFYGLRRSEVVGLKWSAIDLISKTITIKHTVTSDSLDGKLITIEKDRTKNKARLRTLPLVDAVYGLLVQMKEQTGNQPITLQGFLLQRLHRLYFYVDAMGDRIKLNYIPQHFALVLKKNGMRHIRFHDLCHSCASLLLANSGMPIKTIASRWDVSRTTIYRYLNKDHTK